MVAVIEGPQFFTITPTESRGLRIRSITRRRERASTLWELPLEIISTNDLETYLLRCQSLIQSVLITNVPIVSDGPDTSSNPLNWLPHSKWAITHLWYLDGRLTLVSGTMTAPTLFSIGPDLNMGDAETNLALSTFVFCFCCQTPSNGSALRSMWQNTHFGYTVVLGISSGTSAELRGRSLCSLLRD